MLTGPGLTQCYNMKLTNDQLTVNKITVQGLVSCTHGAGWGRLMQFSGITNKAPPDKWQMPHVYGSPTSTHKLIMDYR